MNFSFFFLLKQAVKKQVGIDSRGLVLHMGCVGEGSPLYGMVGLAELSPEHLELISVPLG